MLHYSTGGGAFIRRRPVIKPDRLLEITLLFWALMPAAFAVTWIPYARPLLASEKPPSLSGEGCHGVVAPRS